MHPLNRPIFRTERFTVAPIDPAKVRELLGVLLQDEALAKQVPWMEDKSQDGALREAYLLHLQCAAGFANVWAIVERSSRLFIGAVLAHHALEGIDVEVLCASAFWNQGVADEAGMPVVQWLDDNAEFELRLPQ